MPAKRKTKPAKPKTSKLEHAAHLLNEWGYSDDEVVTQGAARILADIIGDKPTDDEVKVLNLLGAGNTARTIRELLPDVSDAPGSADA
jgi:hypothetical protein